MGSIIKTISIPDRYSTNIKELEESLSLKNRTFSSFVTDKILELSEVKIKTDISLNSSFEDVEDFVQKGDLDELKTISYKAHILNLMCEAYIKYQSYEGHRNKKFANPREAENYLH